MLPPSVHLMSNCQEHQVLTSETTATQGRSTHLPIAILSRREILAPLPTISPHPPLFLNRQVGPHPARLTVTLLLPVLQCPKRGQIQSPWEEGSFIPFRSLSSASGAFTKCLIKNSHPWFLGGRRQGMGRGLGSRIPEDAKIQGCSGPFYKMA